MRRAAKKDAPQAAIVQALRAIGVVVFVQNAEGLPDLLLYDARGRCPAGNPWLPLEVKRSPKAKLTSAQARTQTIAPFPVVSTVSQALRLFGVEVA